MTTDHVVPSEWTEIHAGPTAEGIFVEAYDMGRPVLFRVDTVTPTSEFGHRLDGDTHGQNVTLADGEKLYAKCLNGTSTAIVTGS